MLYKNNYRPITEYIVSVWTVGHISNQKQLTEQKQFAVGVRACWTSLADSLAKI